MKVFKWLAVSLFVVLVLIVLWVMSLHWRHHEESIRFGAAVMEQAPGEFATLSAGPTHYQFFGETQSDADTVVLVHGFSIPSTAWGDIPQRLAASGYRVLAYDLFGRGYSDRPDVPYTGELYVQQLIELLDALNIDEPVHIVGLSMGGAVAARAVAKHPERFHRLGLVAPLHEPIMPPGISANLGYYMVSAFYVPMLESALHDDTIPRDIAEQLQESYQQQKQVRGFTRALTSSIYHFTPDDHARFYRQLAAQQTPVWLAWGTADTTVPFALNEAVREDAGVAEKDFIIFEGAGHMPHIQHPESFTSALVSFLRGSEIGVFEF